jgi:predicted metal-dependent hydrolase
VTAEDAGAGQVGAEGAAARTQAEPRVEVRRSARRKRSVSAYRDGDKIIVLIPAWFSRKQEHEWVTSMVAKVLAKPNGRKQPRSDEALSRRAQELSSRYLDGRAVPASVQWVGNMRSRWGSCTPSDASIRLSDRLKAMPEWVQDYVLVHELAHLLEGGHGEKFWAWVNRYPRTERARGYLDGFSDGSSQTGG